jgi:hypothetical protein
MRRGLVTSLAVLVLALLAPAAASAWAPASSATIHPGVQTFTDGAQCTSNFVFSGGGATYLGQAAHCAGTGAATDTNGCDSASLPLGTPVEITGAAKPGTLVYSSWLTMQATHEADANTCAFNDLALVRIDPADVGKVNPSVPGFGGPTGVGTAAAGDTVYSYGNSELRGGVSTLSPKQGTVVAVDGGGWSYNVYTLSPGVPGDSGSGFLSASGQAIGVLSTLDFAPTPGSNGVGALGLELAYMHAHGNGANVVPGTEAFQASLTAALTGMRTAGASTPAAPAAQQQSSTSKKRAKARRRSARRHRARHRSRKAARRRAARRAHARHRRA